MRMKTMAIIGSLAVIGIFLVALFQTGPAISAENLPAPDAEEVWEYITKEKDYTEWINMPGHPGMYPGKSPHGKFLKMFLNHSASWSLEKELPEMSDHSLIVKENYKDEKTLDAITLMYKYYGYNPDGGDWFWGKYAPDGKVIKAGKVDSCIQCHKSTGFKDYILTEPDLENFDPVRVVGPSAAPSAGGM